MDIYIYKTVFTTELEGKIILENKGVWEEISTETSPMFHYINGTKAVVNIGKVVKTPGTYDEDGNQITPPVYYPGWAYDIMTTDILDFGNNEVFPAEASSHSFYGWPRASEVPPREQVNNDDDSII
jgi:hypothetical protein